MEESKKTFVFDTNVILHDNKCWSSFKEHDIVIPIEVLSEVDKFKSGDNPINYNAREFIRFLDSLPEEEIFDGGSSLGQGLGKIRVVLSFDYHERLRKIFPEEKLIDHKIVNTAYCLSVDPTNKDTKVIFVSKDVNLRMKAKALGLRAEDYKTDVVTDVSSLYKGARTVTVSEEFMADLWSNSETEFKEEAYENEFFILNANSDKRNMSSALATFRKGKLFLIVKSDAIKPLGISPKNSEQMFAMSALLNPDIKLVTIIGKAGTGKTIISLAAGLSQLGFNNDGYESLLFTRQTMSLNDRDIGFLPGGVGEKINPYMNGMWDNLAVVSALSKKDGQKIQKLLDANRVIIEPLSYIRGRSLLNKFFIVDEVQTLTPQEVKAIITRAGQGTKIILIGDISQNDNPRLNERSNGLSYVIAKMRGQDFYAHIVLKRSERSRLAKVAGDLL